MAGGERQVRAHDGVPAQEVPALVEQVHRAALALGEAVTAPEQLRHRAPRIAALGQAVAVLAIRRDGVVVVAQRGGDAGRDRLLADRQVQEAPDLAEGVVLRRLLLEAADQHHVGEEAPRQLRVEPRAGGRPLRVRRFTRHESSSTANRPTSASS
jgi:hypothetical protein